MTVRASAQPLEVPPEVRPAGAASPDHSAHLRYNPPVKPILDSIRVVELTEALAGPYCAMLLGDFGADVIKVERPSTGDQTRGWGPPFIGSESAYFLAANRNKRAITLNYDDARDAEILQRLLSTADVFISSQASLASLQKRALDPETLHSKYPRLIHCNISGYGLTGPKSGRPGYDILAQAESGVMTFTGEPDGEPMRYPIAIADLTCGMYAAMGILAALFARERTGRGQFLDMALFDAQLTWLANVGSNYLNANALPQRWGNAHPSIVPYQMFRAGDGKYFVVGVGTELLWRKFVQALDADATLARIPGSRTTRCVRPIARNYSPRCNGNLIKRRLLSGWRDLRARAFPARQSIVCPRLWATLRPKRAG